MSTHNPPYNPSLLAPIRQYFFGGGGGNLAEHMRPNANLWSSLIPIKRDLISFGKVNSLEYLTLRQPYNILTNTNLIQHCIRSFMKLIQTLLQKKGETHVV